MSPPAFESFVAQIVSRTKYQYQDRAKRDAVNALKNYRNLSPKQEMFVFNDGSKKELMCLDGTIPVRYKGVVYNIPVCIWLLDSHPYNAPLCYVKPTMDMEIKASQHVDYSGRVYLPYLHDWNPNSSDLLGVVQVMIMVFGDRPPVFSRPKKDANPLPYTQTTMNQPYNPIPPVPYPQASGNQPQPPYPPMDYSGAYPRYPIAGSTPYSPYPLPTNNSTTAGQPFPMGATSAYPPYPLQPPSSLPNPIQSGITNQGIQQQAGTTGTTGTISQFHIRASLLSAVEDRIKKRLKESLAQTQAEMEVLRKTHDDLNSGKVRLEEICTQLDKEQTELESSISVLREKNEEMQDLLVKLEGQDDIDIDEVVVTTAPIYKQLLNAFAEESATEDAIYYLGEALRKGMVDLDVFLKKVRELSRKQFMLRALMQKCREKAGLSY